MAFTDYILGENDDLIEFSTVGENRQIAQALAEQASRTVHIFTTDLDSAIYDTAAFVDAAAQMARAHPRAQVMVLVQNATRAATNGHRLVEVAQRLSSRVQIRRPAEEYRDLTESFMVADGTGYFRRIVPARYEGVANFRDPLKSRELTNLFEEIWQRSHADPQLRRLHL